MKLEIYEVDNPYWLSDTFVFAKKEYDSTSYGKIELVCFIKVNCHNKIEEIGCNFEDRFHNTDYKTILEYKHTKEASIKHRRRFLAIDDEYWFKLYNLYVLRKKGLIKYPGD